LKYLKIVVLKTINTYSGVGEKGSEDSSAKNASSTNKTIYIGVILI